MQLRPLHQFKKIIRNLLAIITRFFFWTKYCLYLKKVAISNGELIVFDLDNTLANTFPYIRNGNIKKTYINLPAHKGMVKILEECIKLNKSVIIISAREYRHYFITKSWVKQKVKSKKQIPVFLVPKAIDKLPYLIKAGKEINHITYYDDLSYNHENGEVKFYRDVIEKVRQMSIKYIGYEEIISINSKE